MQSKVLRIFLIFNFLFVITLLFIVYACGRNEISSSPPPPRSSDGGYFLSLSYLDQITAATINIMSLQCWAATFKQIRVVEPFLHRASHFGADLTAVDDHVVRMRDVLDMKSWHHYSSRRGYSPIVSWNHFLQHTPRDLILVFKACPVYCTPEKRIEYVRNFYNTTLVFVKSNGFRVIRSVNNTKGYLYTDQEFSKFVYGGYSPDNTVVLFNTWGGIENKGPVRAYREGISDMKNCSRGTFTDLKWLKNSELIKKDAQHYREQYLDRKYISVMFRSEHFAIRYNLNELTPEKQASLLTKCVNAISKYVNVLKKKHKIDSVFLTVDCRKQGSNKFNKASFVNTKLKQAATLLYQQLYGNSSSLEDWDDSFDKISSYKAPGYIAQLQKYVAASGTYLLTAGGGSFQESARLLHEEMHKNSSYHLDQC